jgi:hypothetical protein
MADDEIYRKSRAALEAAVWVTGGDFHRVDFDAARALWLSQLTVEERALVDKIEAAMEASGDRRTAEAARLLEDLGCSNVPPPERLHRRNGRTYSAMPEAPLEIIGGAFCTCGRLMLRTEGPQVAQMAGTEWLDTPRS